MDQDPSLTIRIETRFRINNVTPRMDFEKEVSDEWWMGGVPETIASAFCPNLRI